MHKVKTMTFLSFFYKSITMVILLLNTNEPIALMRLIIEMYVTVGLFSIRNMTPVIEINTYVTYFEYLVEI